MCVIVVKPRGIKIPPKSILQKCWDHNSHGVGYAINIKGETDTYVQKGFMDFDGFYKSLMEENIRKSDILIMHFRLFTHGKKIPEHTHPFPVSKDKTDLELLAYSSNMICAHNGVFHLANQPNDISDTMYYIQFWLTKFKLASLISDKTEVERLTKDIDFSKLALLINGTMHLLGSWEKHQGCYYSNLYFLHTYTWSSKFASKHTNVYTHNRFTNPYGHWYDDYHTVP